MGKSKLVSLTVLILLVMMLTIYLDYRYVATWSVAQHLSVKEHVMQGGELMLLLAWNMGQLAAIGVVIKLFTDKNSDGSACPDKS